MKRSAQISAFQRVTARVDAAIGWVRKHLFRNLTDSAITLIVGTAVLWVVFHLFEWAVLNSVWQAASLEECLEIIRKLHGAEATGACWAVFNGRLGEVLFGPYPPELYWRPIAACFLVIAAVVPILITKRFRHLIWVSAAFPFVASFLLWGGGTLEPVPSRDIGGVLLVLIFAMMSTPIAIFFGIVLAIARTYAIAPIRLLCCAFIAFCRGVPLIVLLFTIGSLIVYFLPPNTSIDIILRGLVILALPTGAIIAATLHETLSDLPKGQTDVADALGLSKFQTFRLITLPQALKIETPTIIHAVSSLCRNISVIMVLGFLDPVGMMRRIRADRDWNGTTWEWSIIAMLLYGLISFALSQYARHCEKKLNAECLPIRSTRIEE